MYDLEDHPFHPANVARESGAPDQSERAWFRFIRRAESLLGHDLDGDDVEQAGEGYSLDEAYRWFEAGKTAASYVETVRGRSRYNPSAQS